MVKEADFRQDMDAGRMQWGDEPFPPHKYSKDELIIVYGDMSMNELDEEAFDGFLHWVLEELQSEKEKQKQPLYRHKVIMLQGKQWMDSDIDYHSAEGVISEEMPLEMRERYNLTVGDRMPMINIGIYTALRTRNPGFTRKSFSAGEDMWDELGDLL